MATTVGANSLDVETVVSQPCSDQVDLMVDGLDYVFDQAKFEEYLSSSSKSSSPRKHRRNSIPKREVRSVIVRDESRNNTPANCKAGSSAHNDSMQNKESSYKDSTTLTKRARQRQRQKLARQIAKALESTDEIHYRPGSRQQNTTPQPRPVNTPAKEEWVLVKRTCLTKKERAQKRRARAARTRAILRKAQASKSTQGSSRVAWIPKSAKKQPQNTTFVRDSTDCLAGSETVQLVAPAARQSKPSRQPRDSVGCRARRPDTRDTSGRLAQTSFTRDTSDRLGQREVVPDTSSCPGQTSSSPLRLSTSQKDVSTTKPEKSASVLTASVHYPETKEKHQCTNV